MGRQPCDQYAGGIGGSGGRSPVPDERTATVPRWPFELTRWVFVYLAVVVSLLVEPRAFFAAAVATESTPPCAPQAPWPIGAFEPSLHTTRSPLCMVSVAAPALEAGLSF